MKSKDHAILEIFYVKYQAIWLAEGILVPKFKNQTVKVLEITKSICWFYGFLPICIKWAE